MRQIFTHEKALCESESVGENTRIWAFTHIMKDVVIGTDCNIGDHCFIESGVRIGNCVTIKNGVSVWNGVEIQDDAFLGPNCVLTNDLFPRSKIYHPKNISTVIKKGASIGANATIVCGITLGEYCMIAAGAVVTKDVPPFCVIKGVPGKISGYVSEDGDKLIFDAHGISTDKLGNIYKKNENELIFKIGIKE